MQIGRTAATSGVCPEASTDTGPHAEPAMALSPPR
jgi:hypothetical protein